MRIEISIPSTWSMASVCNTHFCLKQQIFNKRSVCTAIWNCAEPFTASLTKAAQQKSQETQKVSWLFTADQMQETVSVHCGVLDSGRRASSHGLWTVWHPTEHLNNKTQTGFICWCCFRSLLMLCSFLSLHCTDCNSVSPKNYQ